MILSKEKICKGFLDTFKYKWAVKNRKQSYLTMKIIFLGVTV